MRSKLVEIKEHIAWWVILNLFNRCPVCGEQLIEVKGWARWDCANLRCGRHYPVKF